MPNYLLEALKNNGVKAKMLVRDKRTDQITVASLPQSPGKAKSIWERVCQANRFASTTCFSGPTSQHRYGCHLITGIQRSRCHHLHWVTKASFPESSIRRIIDSGKPIVWTMRSMAVYRHLPLQRRVHEIPKPSTHTATCLVMEAFA